MAHPVFHWTSEKAETLPKMLFITSEEKCYIQLVTVFKGERAAINNGSGSFSRQHGGSAVSTSASQPDSWVQTWAEPLCERTLPLRYA